MSGTATNKESLLYKVGFTIGKQIKDLVKNAGRIEVVDASDTKDFLTGVQNLHAYLQSKTYIIQTQDKFVNRFLHLTGKGTSETTLHFSPIDQSFTPSKLWFLNCVVIFENLTLELPNYPANYKVQPDDAPLVFEHCYVVLKNVKLRTTSGNANQLFSLAIFSQLNFSEIDTTESTNAKFTLSIAPSLSNDYNFFASGSYIVPVKTL